MTSYENDNPLVDEMFDEDIDYTIVFDRGLGILTAPGFETSYTGHGVDGALGAMAQILVQMSESDFDFDIESAKIDSSASVTADDLGLNDDLRKIRESISQFTETIDQAADQNSPDVAEAIKQRNNFRSYEKGLVESIESIDRMLLNGKHAVELLELIEKIIADTKSGNLDLEAEVAQELLEAAGVPDGEPRRTVGALIFHYVAHLASEPISDEPDDEGPGTALATLLPKAYLFVDPTE